MPDIASLEKAVGYSFRNKELLLTALRNPSLKNDGDGDAGKKDNQRLEFLGDAVLGLLSAEQLFRRHDTEDEGLLTIRRTQLVCGDSLIGFAEKIKLAEYIQLGKQAKMYNEKYLADALEAIFGAAWLDGGLEAAEAIFKKLEFIKNDPENPGSANPKGALQEYFQKRNWGNPKYSQPAVSGPKHAPVFKTELKSPDGHTVIGCGHSRRLAESDAAERMLKLLKHGE